MAGCLICVSYYILVFFLTYSCTDGLTCHIIPSSNSQCPNSMQPCLIISQLVLDASTYFQPNFSTILFFEPGAHYFNSTALIIGGLSSVYFMKSNVNVPSDDMSSSIICDYSNFYLYNITFVHIRGIDLIGCDINSESIGHISIEDTKFFGQENMISGLELVRSSAVIERSSFISNTIGKIMEIDEVIPVHAGGAIALAQSDVTIMDSTFTQNSAEIGGALFADDGSTVTIINSIFERNHVTCQTGCYGNDCHNGCMITIPLLSNDSNYLDIIELFPHGGAIVMQHSKIEISGCRFTNNSAAGYHNGGSMYIWESTAIIRNSEFNNSTAGKSGGAIYAIDQIGTSILNITGSSFSDNRAGKEGGAIYWESVDRKSLMIIHTSWFFSNTVEDIGGAIMIKSGEAIIIFGQFNDNNATTAGGAIYVYDSIACNVVESEISDSKSNIGGAICALLSLVIISKCNLSRNEAQESGGVINLSASTVHISASMIDDMVIMPTLMVEQLKHSQRH